MKFLPYQAEDSAEIQALYEKVFGDAEGLAEGKLIGMLVRDMMAGTAGSDLLGFFAQDEHQIIGGTFYTRLWFEQPLNAFILSPVAVLTGYQRQGVGKSLINFGISQLKAHGVALLFTYGDPNYYSHVGFEPISEELIKAPLPLSQPEGWLCQTLDGSEIKPIPGNSRCVSALNKKAYW